MQDLDEVIVTLETSKRVICVSGHLKLYRHIRDDLSVREVDLILLAWK